MASTKRRYGFTCSDIAKLLVTLGPVFARLQHIRK